MAEQAPNERPGGRRRAAVRALGLFLAAIAVAVIAPQVASMVSGGSATSAAHSTAPVDLGVARDIFSTHEPKLHAQLTTATSAHWAQVLREVRVYRRPGGAMVSKLSPHTPEGLDAIVQTLAQRRDRTGQVWTQVRLPILPNNSTGWVDRNALGGYHVVHTRLVVDRRTFTLTLWRSGRVAFRAPVGVGRSYWPTPAGHFVIREKLTRFASPFYGPIAFGTSARSAVLTDWPGGGYIGIHGTDQPQLIPGAISHGCIRLRNADIVRLDRILPIGTPLTIR